MAIRTREQEAGVAPELALHMYAQMLRIRAFEEQDTEKAGELLWPDVVMFGPEGWPEPGPDYGREAVVQQFLRLAEDWSRYSMTIQRADTADHAVVARLHWRTQGAASDIPMELEMSGVYLLRDGRIAEMRFFWDHDAALDAAGLRR